MNVERARALWKKALPYVLTAFALGAIGTTAYRHLAGDCCQPGASCCYPGSPCCAGKGHLAKH